MKTALLHYWMIRMRGGEKVLSALAEMYPDSDIFTHAFNKSALPEFQNFNVRESFIASLPFGRRKPQMYLPLMPFATRKFDLSGYDLVISSESGPIKGIKGKTGRHICYCHSPMRYLWDLYDEYYRSAGIGGKIAMRLFTPYLRRADLKSAESVDVFVANSRFVAQRIKRIYGRDSTVVNPPVNVEFFSQAKRDEGHEPYYLFAGAPVKYKRLDLAKAACERMGRKLIIAGGGNVDDKELRNLYANATALLFPGIEDFGIVPVEAQASGCPVIAYNEGGTLETVIADETGLFFAKQNVETLCNAIEEFESRNWNRARCRENANRFSKQRFISEMKAITEPTT